MLATPELQIARNLPAEGCDPAEAQRYTRWLATHHYENFNVVSRLLPRRLHQDFYNVYAYCRWSDDLGDEVADPARALVLLACLTRSQCRWWRISGWGRTGGMRSEVGRRPAIGGQSPI